jgi:hypothetical protein
VKTQANLFYLSVKSYFKQAYWLREKGGQKDSLDSTQYVFAKGRGV